MAKENESIYDQLVRKVKQIAFIVAERQKEREREREQESVCERGIENEREI